MAIVPLKFIPSPSPAEEEGIIYFVPVSELCETSNFDVVLL